MNVFFVAALRAFAAASARHQFGSRSRRPELDNFAQKNPQPAGLPFDDRLSISANARNLKLLSRINPSASA